MKQGNLNKTMIIFLGILFSGIVNAESPVSSIKINSLPDRQTQALMGGQPPVSVTSDAKTKKIAAGLKQTLQNLKQQPIAKSIKSQSTKATRRISKKSTRNIKFSLRKDGSVRQMKGGILESPSTSSRARSGKQSNELTARKFLRRYRYSLSIANPDKELYLLNQHTDDLGRNHLKYGQRYQGLPVWPADIVVHFSPEGGVDLMNGSYAPTPHKSLSIKPRISKEEAKAIAFKSLKTVTTKVEKEPELIFYYSKSKHQLAWKLRININTETRWLVIVDAINGEVLLKYNEIVQAGVTGLGTDLFNREQPLQLFEQNGSFFLLDTSKPMFDPNSTPPNPNATRGGIFLLDAQNQNAEEASFNPSLVNSRSPNTGFLPDAVSAAINISEVYDYYLDRHNRNSIDGNGGSLFGIVRVGQNFMNAFWNGKAMFFGDGDRFAAALDIVAHEISHGVTQATANLIYQGQSGALNEAFSDIFGEMVEARSIGNDWIMGTETDPKFQRSFRNPSSLLMPGTNVPYPAKMSEFIFMQEDNGGVHINSGIINSAYYQLAEGLDGAIGIRDAERIFYRALTTHLVRNSQFIDARLAAITSADELFGADSIQSRKVAEAFDKVEIFDNVASTPPPRSIPAVNGQDATLFVCFNDTLGANFLCRNDASLGDPDNGIFLTSFDVFAKRPSVSGDGSFAVFVDSVNDICFISLDGLSDEKCLGFPGTVYSISLSADGRFFGFIELDNNNQPKNSITVLGLGDNDSIQTFKLVAPAIDASTTDSIAFADVMNFTADGRLIIYDALTELNLLDGNKINSWGIYALDIVTGQTFTLISASPGVNISNPSLGHTSDNFMTFALSETDGTSSTIVTANLNTGQLEAIASVDGLFSVPVFNGDDSVVIFDQLDQSAATGTSLLSQDLQKDHLSPTGEAKLWLFDAVFGVVYRRGVFNAPQEESAYYDPATEILRIHAVDVVDNLGQITTFEANLKIINFQPIVLRLISANVTNTGHSGGGAVFDSRAGKMILPRLSITDNHSNTQIFKAEMSLISDAFDFQVTVLEPIQ